MSEKFLLLGLFLTLFSCSNEKIEESPNRFSFNTKNEIIDGKSVKVFIPSTKLQQFINEYIILKNNKYYVNVSKSEASEIGIEMSLYDELCNEVNKTNQMLADLIEEYSKRSDIKSIKIINCNSVNSSTENITTTKSTDMPSGVISTSGQETNSMDFVAPTEMKSVYAHCFSNASLIAGHTVLVEVSGEVNIGTRFANGYVTVGLPISNASGTVSFRTTDSNGGRCSWRGI